MSMQKQFFLFNLCVFMVLQACSAPTNNAPANPSASPRAEASARPVASPSSQASPVAGLVSPSPVAKPAGTFIKTTQSQYNVGEPITVLFGVDSTVSLDKTAWVGLLQASTPHGSATENDKFDYAYEYLEGRREGQMTFPGVDEPGDFDVRLHDAETGKELIHAAFKIVGTPKPLTGNALRLNKSRYAAGEDMIITVSIKAEDKKDESAWLGIVPAAVDHGDEAINDRYNLGYKFLGKLLYGQTVLPAPKAPGLYDIRLHDTDTEGKELAFVSFLVE